MAPMTRAALARIALFIVAAAPAAADTYPRQPGVDIQHYVFRITLSDATDDIAGEAMVDVRFARDGVTSFELDLIGAAGRADGGGMRVAAVTAAGRPTAFVHRGDRLQITVQPASTAGERRRFAVAYGGQPAMGLIIGPNRHGDRTFFSDNWPDKARHWLPTLDHPGDKATCEFVVTAPAQYQVVSNGLLIEETDTADGRRITHWKQSVPIASWLYVLGAARFAVQHLADHDGRPVQTWVYAQDRDAGFHDFAVPTHQVLEFYGRQVGPYAYEKLANVQARSVGGGMEAATAIFYGENLVTGDRSVRLRNVIIHEIAHQWWGNAVTEDDWDHVWLSEGFATYFTLLFIEHAYGRDAFVAGLRDSRRRVREFHDRNPAYRVVHDNLSDMRQVTTSQTYQKGGWTLHMLRGLVGDEAFWAGIREYYRRFRDANASTDDFRRVMEETAGRPLAWFFDQWLRQGGYLTVDGAWRYDAGAGTVELELIQTQRSEPFDMPIEIGLVFDDRSASRVERARLTERQQRFTIPVDREPAAVSLDPNVWVLMDATLVRQESVREDRRTPEEGARR